MRLLEAQAAVGSMTDPLSGEQMSLDDALKRNLIDEDMMSMLRQAEKAVTGFKQTGSNQTISLHQAMKLVKFLYHYDDMNGVVLLIVTFAGSHHRC